MRRGWVNGWSPLYPAKEQREALEAAKVRVIYEASKDVSINDFMLATRAGDTMVIHGMNVLGRTPNEVNSTLLQATEKDLLIEDRLIDRTFPASAAYSYALGRSRGAGAKRLSTPEEASERGKRGGRPKTPLNMTLREAKRVWFDLEIPTNEEAADMIGVGPSWCQRKWGGSGRTRGRRPETDSD